MYITWLNAASVEKVSAHDNAYVNNSSVVVLLRYEGYSLQNATYAVDHVKVNWMVQAARSAQEYLSMEAFSRSGLIEQLEYEGYTSSQAVYGVNHAR